MTVPAVRVVHAGGCSLGEGPLWDDATGDLLYVDIFGRALHRYAHDSGRHSTLTIDGRPSFVVRADDDSLLVGSDRGLHRVGDAGLGECLTTLDEPERNRTNDATVDAHGRLWFGTMDTAETHATGALYCYDAGALHRTTATAIVTNGPAVTPDARTLYFVDSVERTVWRYAVGPEATLLDPQPFVRLRADEGHPDGITLDAEQCLWVALWDGGGVRRYSPDGRLLLHVPLPCDRVTKLAFGGPDLRTAYVTTACVGLDDAARARQPHAGALFAFDAPAPGLHAHRVRMPKAT